MAENIHQAIVAIMNEVGYVQKEKSPKLQYTFAGEAALIQALRPAMLEQGVYAFVESYLPTRDTYETKGGTTMVSTVATGTVRFVHAPSDTSIVVAAMGEGADPGDKSANKAMTGLLKYALRQTFLIETGDDPDRERPEQEHGSRTTSDGRPAPQKPAQEPQKATRPLSAEKLNEFMSRKVAGYAGREASDKQRGLAMGMLNQCFAGEDADEQRHSVLMHLFAAESGKELSGADVLALLDWLKPEPDSGGAYMPGEFVPEEAVAVVEAQKEAVK